MKTIVCIAPFGDFVPGDTAEVPDDAAVSPHHWHDPNPPVAAAAEDDAPPDGDGPGADGTPEEGA